MSAGFAFARAASQPIMSGVRDFGIAANFQRSAKTVLHHFTLAFGPVPAPGWRRLSSPVFSPGTGSPLAVVELVDAQPLNPQMAAVRMANIKRHFIRLGTYPAPRFSPPKLCGLRTIAGNDERRNL